MSLNDYEIVKLLGKGAFASVYQVKHKQKNTINAMKRVKFGAMSKKEKENALNEIRILASVQHQNIIGYENSFYDDESKTLNIIMEFANEGDLESKIKSHIEKKTNFPENAIWTYLVQTLSGLKALHSVKIMHRDLKCANIFLKNGVLKLGDLNVSKLIKRSQMDHTQTGTPYYASPEVWSNKPYDYKSDIWSVGCIIYELCMLKPPFRALSLEELYKTVLKGKYDPIPSIYSKELSQVIGMMLQVNTSLRPDVFKLLTFPVIMKKVDYSVLDIKETDNNMLNTIKIPKNINEINQQLPKKKIDMGEGLSEKRGSDDNLYKEMKEKEKEKEMKELKEKYLQMDIKNNNSNNNQVNNLKPNNYRPLSGVNSNNYNNIINSNNVNNVNSNENLLNKYNKYSNNPSSINVPTSNNHYKLNEMKDDIYNRYNKYMIEEKSRAKTPDSIINKNIYEVKKGPLVANHGGGNIVKPNYDYNSNKYENNNNPYIIKKSEGQGVLAPNQNQRPVSPLLKRNTPVTNSNSNNNRPASGVPSSNIRLPTNNSNSNQPSSNNNKVLQEKNKYLNILNNNIKPVGGGIVKNGVYDNKYDIGNRVNRNITPDKDYNNNYIKRQITPDKHVNDRRVTPDKYRPQVLGGNNNYKSPYQVNNPPSSLLSKPSRPKTPDLSPRDKKQLIIKKKL